MVRRVASQVHKQVARLMRGDVIETPPLWYTAVLEHPPLPLPAKAPAGRTAFDLDAAPRSTLSAKKAGRARPLPVHYVEDDVRRQFFRDHPFEAFRPRTLAEGQGIEAAHPVTGLAWTRLRQRGRNPSSEDAIAFAVSLHQHHDIPLSAAYARAVGQFRALRSEHHIASTFAAQEAEHLGAGAAGLKSAITAGFMKEIRSLGSWERQAQLDEGALAARKRWRAIVHDHQGTREWSKGEQYVRLWREGVRPDYAPALTQHVVETPQTVKAASRVKAPNPEAMDLAGVKRGKVVTPKRR